MKKPRPPQGSRGGFDPFHFSDKSQLKAQTTRQANPAARAMSARKVNSNPRRNEHAVGLCRNSQLNRELGPAARWQSRAWSSATLGGTLARAMSARKVNSDPRPNEHAVGL